MLTLMPWVYLDDHIDEHDKVIAAGHAAFGLWVCCLAYCRRKLTGGRVPKTWAGVKGEKTKLARLISVGLLEDRGEVWLVHDYERWNHSEEKSRKARASAKARWENANADANAFQTHSERTADAHAHARAPASVPLTPIPVDSSPSSEPLGALDDEELLGRTWKLLAHRRLAKREADVGSVGSRDAWLRSVQAGLPRDYGDEARALLANEGGWTPELLADALEPPVVEIPKPPDPLETTAAAAQKLREKHALPPCAGCDSTGWVDTEMGVIPCEKCERTREAG